MLDAPASGGPRGAKVRILALWGGKTRKSSCVTSLCRMPSGIQPYFVGRIDAGLIAKLVRYCSRYIIQTALAEVFTWGVEAGWTRWHRGRRYGRGHCAGAGHL